MRIDFTFAPEITDEIILKAFEGTSFGRNDYREFLGYSVLQKACGWHCGFTITSIMIALKLITPEHHRVTKLGRMFLSDCYNDPMRNQTVSQHYKLPAGWRLVPDEPTEEMMRAMHQAQDMRPAAHCDNIRKTHMSFARPRYIAALATAPRPTTDSTT